MADTEVENARITSTHLGLEDHGIFTFWLHLDYGSSGQGYGGYGLGSYKQGDSHGLDFGMATIQRVMQVVGVEKWEDLPGKYVRTEHNWTRVTRIGNILKDDWLDLEDLAQEFRKAEV